MKIYSSYSFCFESTNPTLSGHLFFFFLFCAILGNQTFNHRNITQLFSRASSPEHPGKIHGPNSRPMSFSNCVFFLIYYVSFSCWIQTILTVEGLASGDVPLETPGLWDWPGLYHEEGVETGLNGCCHIISPDHQFTSCRCVVEDEIIFWHGICQLQSYKSGH